MKLTGNPEIDAEIRRLASDMAANPNPHSFRFTNGTPEAERCAAWYLEGIGACEKTEYGLRVMPFMHQFVKDMDKPAWRLWLSNPSHYLLVINTGLLALIAVCAVIALL